MVWVLPPLSANAANNGLTGFARVPTWLPFVPFVKPVTEASAMPIILLFVVLKTPIISGSDPADVFPAMIELEMVKLLQQYAKTPPPLLPLLGKLTALPVMVQLVIEPLLANNIAPPLKSALLPVKVEFEMLHIAPEYIAPPYR